MLRDPKVIELLNRHLTNELTAINQYFLHACILDKWGVTKLGRKEYKESIEGIERYTLLNSGSADEQNEKEAG